MSTFKIIASLQDRHCIAMRSKACSPITSNGSTVRYVYDSDGRDFRISERSEQGNRVIAGGRGVFPVE
jgi:hypothetical protein